MCWIFIFVCVDCLFPPPRPVGESSGIHPPATRRNILSNTRRTSIVPWATRYFSCVACKCTHTMWMPHHHPLGWQSRERVIIHHHHEGGIDNNTVDSLCYVNMFEVIESMGLMEGILDFTHWCGKAPTYHSSNMLSYWDVIGFKIREPFFDRK